MEPILTVTDAIDPRAQEAISGGLSRFNLEKSGISDRRPLAVLVSDPETKEILGGLTGRTSLGMLSIQVFFLREQLRRGGLGSRILQLAEEEGRRRGCCAAVLTTISFQAPDFYKRHGYQVLGAVDCHPPGTSRIFMTKRLQ